MAFTDFCNQIFTEANSNLSMTKMTINPKYEFLWEYIAHLPKTFGKKGKEIYIDRNHNKRPQLFNRIIYSYFRYSKGSRAFSYTQALFHKGFEISGPIAYIERKKYQVKYNLNF